jgi:uncharacterized membrane protein
MRNAVTQKTRLAMFAPLALAAFVTVFITSGALAGKPGGGGGTTPTYTYINLGTLGLTGGWAKAINQAGLVVGTAYYDDYIVEYRRGFVVVPKDTNTDGKPDLWFEDQNQDGLNDLQINLGWPPGFVPGEFDWVQATDINDRGQILVVVWTTPNGEPPPTTKAFVLTPADVNGDSKLEFFQDDGNGANALMQSLDLESLSDDQMPSALNNLGQVVGHCYVAGVPVGYVLAGQDTDSDGIADTWFADANNDGRNDLVQTLGSCWEAVRNRPAPITPSDINDQGEIAGGAGIAGSSVSVPCLIRPCDTGNGKVWCIDENQDGLNDLALPLPILSSGRPSGGACAINAAGKVVGASNSGRNNITSFAMLWQVGTGSVQTTQLAPLSGEKYNMATALNSQDVIVGYSGTYRAFVWQNGATKELRLLTDQAAALAGTWMQAGGINDMGAIIGGTEYSGPASHPFITVPIVRTP